MTRVAAVDCGTNSIRLLIADADGRGGLAEVERRTEIVRLGQGVDATGEFHPDALSRTFAATEAYADLVRAAGVPPERTWFVATSAARDARNRQDFFDGIRERLGVTPEVVSGALEAELAFRGALSGADPTGEPVLVMDIGGGSTELVLGGLDGSIDTAVSLDIGSVRLTERFFGSSPPSGAEVARAGAYVDELLAGSPVDVAAAEVFVGVAGTVTTLAGVHLGLPRYDRRKVHGCAIPQRELGRLASMLATLTTEEIRALPSMHPQRADVITAGALIAARVLALSKAAALTVSESDILDGIALRLLSRSVEVRP